METFLTQLSLLAGSSLGVFFFTGAAKKLNAIEVSPRRTLIIRSVATVLAGVTSVAIAWTNGSLSSVELQDLASALIDTAAIAFSAHVLHETTKSK